MNKKERNNQLITLADNAIQATSKLLDKEKQTISESYNGHIAAFSVSIAMSGLLPTMAFYYQDSKSKVNRCTILEVIAKMVSEDQEYIGAHNNAKTFIDEIRRTELSSDKPHTHPYAKVLFQHAINLDKTARAKLQREVIDCAIALKQVVRTYKLVK